jgi:carotenoid cleavage dioxygenase
MSAVIEKLEAPFGESHGPHLTGTFAPIFDELTLEDLPVEGEIPKDLNGVYLRNGPNPHFEPKGTHHYFDGEGMLHAGEFRGGKFTYRNKWVRTEGWLKNTAAGEELHWGVMNSVKGSEDKPMNDVANTDVIGHGGKAVLSWYLAGIPYLVDPITLETIRPAPEYVSGPGNGMSAHCKVDEHTGDLLFFDYFTQKPHMSYGVVSADGKLTHHVPIELPGDRLMHDMGITENYSILHDVPVYHDEAALRAGRHKIIFDASLPIRFGVIPRYGASDSIRWFEFSSCFLYHVVNCWEEGDEIVMVACRYMPARKADGSIDEERTAKMIGGLEMDARLWRYRMNLKTGETREECLNEDHNVEFPTYNSLDTGRYTQWAYLVDHDPGMLRWTGIRKFDTDTGESVGEWSDGHEHCWYSEPWFAPADHPDSEDHGYVVTFCWNDDTRIQELQVFDARKISDGPVARVKLPRRVPPGFHACWMKSSQVENWER